MITTAVKKILYRGHTLKAMNNSSLWNWHSLALLISLNHFSTENSCAAPSCPWLYNSSRNFRCSMDTSQSQVSMEIWLGGTWLWPHALCSKRVPQNLCFVFNFVIIFFFTWMTLSDPDSLVYLRPHNFFFFLSILTCLIPDSIWVYSSKLTPNPAL